MSASGGPFLVKVCGLSTPETLDAALRAGADWVGLVLHPRSPRFVTEEAAAALATQARAAGRASVILLVDPEDDRVDSALATIEPDLVQLHGRETPERVAALRARVRRPVIKAVGVSDAADLAAVRSFIGYADHVLLDAKPPVDAAYPGGHGRPFDWTILSALGDDVPFLLSGGLHPGNVADAIGAARAVGARMAGVDVSTGVETSPGVKDAALIRDFVTAARHAVAAELSRDTP